jgi:uncharacterized protein (DUF736 family)
MTTIGTFTRDGNGFVGAISTLTLKTKANLKPIERTSEQAPDYRVYSAGVEIGAAWSMTSKANKPYISVKLDDPSFPAAILCRLISDESGENHQLVWSR